MSSYSISAILTGRAVRFRAADEQSAIAKVPVDGAVRVTFLGLAGDEQADAKHHGGPDKALHHYAADHYPVWDAELGGHGLLASPGAFGENIATTGLTEGDVWLGDRFRLGSALIEVSHGRQPCWKLGHRFGVTDMAARIVRNGRCGWYYRVIEEGEVAPGDALIRDVRGLAAWPIDRLFHVVIGGGHKRAGDALRELADLPVLAQAWRDRAAQLAG
ncbi:MOSC domain-containing protein [Novosphingobium sp. FSY-8]|uniref:MOSC domain-containing protein n=1 Tax=Novosphingobium ovatum TaxID=1908523 RepID=A0ABW9XEZ4_9SPHN|nr:MOSC domain-containing protein [Novosphingobium ovatum]NBC37058.1 MOSC domain-containing protein [Novosphingobium ovatum]